MVAGETSTKQEHNDLRIMSHSLGDFDHLVSDWVNNIGDDATQDIERLRDLIHESSVLAYKIFQDYIKENK